MTKQSKSGKVSKRRAHDSKNLDDHIVDKTKFVELGVKDAPVENINWDVNKAEVHSDPVYDPGSGPKTIIRRFGFQLPPGLKQTPSHQELMEWHKKNTVIPILWRDELDLVGEPRIVAGKRNTFSIVAVCTPRFVMGVRSHIEERPVNVTEVINKANDPTRDSD